MTSSEGDAIEGARALLGEYEQFLSGKAQGTMEAYLRTARRLVGINVRTVWRAVSRRAVAAGAAGLVVVALRSSGGSWIRDTAWSTLLLCGGAFTVTYVAVLVGLAGGRRKVPRWASRVAAGPVKPPTERSAG